MKLEDIIKERRSIKRFKDIPVPIDTIRSLLETSTWAPNHKLTQPWRFVVVHGDSRLKLAEATRAFMAGKEKDPEKKEAAGQRGYNKLIAVPMFVAVIMEENPNPMTREEDYAATSALIQNFSLLAWEQGIGLIWETYGMIHSIEFREALGVKPGEKIVGSLHVGYPDMIPAPRPRNAIDQLLTIMD
ncbi:nitroreductase [Peribacillus simplex]|uniref:Putative NAD(P)H nitroreductase n=1 Tax=Peribacillus simplex TaxID=1478 RepID=A0AAW7IKB0_9BACI|nr:nitroreductase [Peribacillus simplex]AMM91584.1 nitroreductase [Peribacillus simplex]MDM5296495.1 nitroreductase [Peribacillus simplex]MDM5455536.1 nitroreductase [Peribacillus simplex]